MPDESSHPGRSFGRNRRWVFVLVGVAVLVAAVVAIHAATSVAERTEPVVGTIDREVLAKHGITYSLEVKTKPRPLRVHRLKIDLAHKKTEVACALVEDPDGEGPATTKLTPPVKLAERTRAIALVNANPWQSLVDKWGNRHTNWSEDLPVEVLGLVVSDGKMRNAYSPRYCAFWVDRAKKPHVGRAPKTGQASVGVAGFRRLLNVGRNVHKPTKEMHPRTAVGFDAEGRFLHLVVVDGRQPGRSEGMNCFELAEYMKGLGCHAAVNLDGGGSSVMILSDRKGARRVVNRPSTIKNGKRVARPIPVGLVVRKKK